jgi:hypothetical protein
MRQLSPAALQLTCEKGRFAAKCGNKPSADQVRSHLTCAVIEVNLIRVDGKTPPRGDLVPVPAKDIMLDGCAEQ